MTEMATENKTDKADSEKTVPGDDNADVATPLDGDTDKVTAGADLTLPDELPPWSAYRRIFAYGGTTELVLQLVGVFCAIGSGAGIAVQNLIFGSFITSITDFSAGISSPSAFVADAADLALWFVYLGIIRFVLSYVYNVCLTYSGYLLVRNIRREYVRAALSQEVAFFDFAASGSVATQATSNGKLIQGGVAEKLGLAVQGLAAFITAFAIAFATQWKLTLICLCIAPATIVVMGVVATLSAGHETAMLGIFGKANAFAEGVLASVRTVHAFEMRERLVSRFDGYLDEAHTVGKKLNLLYGILFSAEYTIIYLGFGLAFWQGIALLASGEITSVGDIFTYVNRCHQGVMLTSQCPPLRRHRCDIPHATRAILHRLLSRRDGSCSALLAHGPRVSNRPLFYDWNVPHVYKRPKHRDQQRLLRLSHPPSHHRPRRLYPLRPCWKGHCSGRTVWLGEEYHCRTARKVVRPQGWEHLPRRPCY